MPFSTNRSNWQLILFASLGSLMSTPASMFRCCAASVKLAEVKSVKRPSITTALACRTALFLVTVWGCSADQQRAPRPVLRVQRVPGCAADGSWRLAKKRSERSRNGGNHQRTVEQLVASLAARLGDEQAAVTGRAMEESLFMWIGGIVLRAHRIA